MNQPHMLLRLLVVLGLSTGSTVLAQSEFYTVEGNVHAVSLRDAGGEFHAGDIDGDGDLDLVAGVYAVQKVALEILINDGHERFSERFAPSSKSAPVPFHFALATRLADFDSDGDLDIALVSYFAPGLELWENDGNGNFSLGNGKKFKVPHLANPQPNYAAAYAHEVKDVDGDGDSDILVGRHAERSLLLLNDGFGVFTESKALAGFTRKGWVYEVDMGDVNNDGVLDLLFSDWVTGQEIWISDKARGVYVRGSAFPYTFSLFNSIVDLDGDGNADLVLEDTYSSNESFLYRGDGKGGFTWARTFSNRLDHHFIADFDGDGDQDLFFRGFAGLRLFRNDGNLAFVDVSQSALPPDRATLPFFMNPVDFDGDGDTDMVAWKTTGVPRGPELHLFRSRLRHVEAPRQVKLGQNLQVDLFANDRHGMVLGLSHRERYAPLLTWGSLFLDPATTLLMPPRTVSQRRPESWMFSIPVQQQLVGLKVSFQALDTPPGTVLAPRLSNLKQVEIVK